MGFCFSIKEHFNFLGLFLEVVIMLGILMH
jgi:hypothetical protein